VARDEHADLIFMPTHARQGFDRLLLGSVAERVARLSMIPVMLMRLQANPAPLFEKIVLPVDGSETSQLAVQQAHDLAKQLGAKITVLHVIERTPSPFYVMDGGLSEPSAACNSSALRRKAEDITARVVQALGDVPVQTRIVRGDTTVGAAINLETEAVGGDLILMGTHGRGGFERLLLGSVAETVAHHAKVPVLLVSPSQRAEAWKTSVLGEIAEEVASERARKASRVPVVNTD
jgi:nucleotide-binding universal stress UspA family protein